MIGSTLGGLLSIYANLHPAAAVASFGLAAASIIWITFIRPKVKVFNAGQRDMKEHEDTIEHYSRGMEDISSGFSVKAGEAIEMCDAGIDELMESLSPRVSERTSASITSFLSEEAS